MKSGEREGPHAWSSSMCPLVMVVVVTVRGRVPSWWIKWTECFVCWQVSWHATLKNASCPWPFVPAYFAGPVSLKMEDSSLLGYVIRNVVHDLCKDCYCIVFRVKQSKITLRTLNLHWSMLIDECWPCVIDVSWWPVTRSDLEQVLCPLNLSTCSWILMSLAKWSIRPVVLASIVVLLQFVCCTTANLCGCSGSKCLVHRTPYLDGMTELSATLLYSYGVE